MSHSTHNRWLWYWQSKPTTPKVNTRNPKN